jgi:hypothetical protein
MIRQFAEQDVVFLRPQDVIQRFSYE